MRISVLTSPDELADVADQWQELSDVAGGRATTQRFWCLPWWRHLGRGVPLVVTVHAGGRLVAGSAALARLRGVSPAAVIAPSNACRTLSVPGSVARRHLWERWARAGGMRPAGRRPAPAAR